jgi:hypothetical protein
MIEQIISFFVLVFLSSDSGVGVGDFLVGFVAIILFFLF